MSPVQSPSAATGIGTAKPLNSKNFGAICVLLGFINLFFLPSAMSRKWPPEFDVNWALAAIVASVAAGFGVEAARNSKSWRLRGFSNFGLTLAALTFLIPFYGYFENFHDFPWVVAVPFAVALAAGCVVARNYLVLAGMGVFFGGLLLPPILTPNHACPVTKTIDGLSITLDSLSEIELKMADGSDPRSHFDISSTESSILAGPFAQAKGWRPCSSMNEDGTESRTRYYIREFVPGYAKTVGLQFRLAEWPAEAAAQVVVDVPSHHTADIPSGADNRGPIQLGVSCVRWGNSEVTTFPPDAPGLQVLLLQVRYSGYSYGGSTGREFSIQDDLGHGYGRFCSRVDGWGGGTTESLEIQGLDPKARKLTVRAYSENQLKDAERIVTFNNLPAAQAQP